MVTNFLRHHCSQENGICNIIKRKQAEYDLTDLPHGEYTQLDKDQRLLTNSDLLSVSEDTLHEDLQRILLGILSINIFTHNLHNMTENTWTVRAEGTEW